MGNTDLSCGLAPGAYLGGATDLNTSYATAPASMYAQRAPLADTASSLQAMQMGPGVVTEVRVYEPEPVDPSRRRGGSPSRVRMSSPVRGRSPSPVRLIERAPSQRVGSPVRGLPTAVLTSAPPQT